MRPVLLTLLALMPIAASTPVLAQLQPSPAASVPLAEDINAPDKDGMTPLMLAIQAHDAEETKALLYRGANVQALDNGGNTALMLASQWGDADIVKRLLDLGASVDVKNKHSANDNGGGVTALMWAARYGHLEAIKLLVDAGASLTLGDNGGHGGALFWSGSYGEAAATKLLLDRGAPINAKDKDGKTALYWAERPYPGVSDEARDQTVAVLKSASGTD